MKHAGGAVLWAALAMTASAANSSRTEIEERLDALEAEVAAAEDVRAIKRLQRAYGYYLDKGMWEDLSALFTDDAVANYPAGTYIGKASIREHLFRNVGNVPVGEVGLGDNRLYNHMNIQPVVHLDPGGESAKGRWRAFAMFGSFGRGATWAEGVYLITYAKVDGVWKIRTLDYYSGFGAPYETGWVAPQATSEQGSSRPRRQLPHPPDKVRNNECDGFAPACIPPFHYENPGRSEAGARVWTATPKPGKGNVRARAADLAHRASLLHDEQQIENLQRIYGYYLDRAMWDHIADLFAEDGTIEMGLRGVYVGRKRIREFLSLLGPHGLKDGWLNDRIQLQVLVSVAPDGKTARARSRELGMTGQYQGTAQWSEGIYENTFVKENGVWKFHSLRFYPTFISDYDKGWAKDAQPAPGVSTQLPPDRPPSQLYEIYPKAHIPPYHYRNPVTGKPPHYPPPSRGGPDPKVAAAALEPVRTARRPPPVKDVEAAIAAAERTIQRVKDYHELENLESAYGYYVDKNLWSDLADLFSRDSSMELAQRGVYQGHDRVRAFLVNVFGRGKEGPVAGRLGNHIQMQPVITIAEDGQSAKIRLRMIQQLNFGSRASMGGAIYENEAVKENGIWKISKLHAYNTFTAGYEGGWAKNPGRSLPGPSKDFPPDAPPTLKYEAFPTVYDIPFHYANPVTGRTETPPITRVNLAEATKPAGMPPEIAAALREIGPRIEGPKTAALYAPLQPKEPYQNVKVARDVSYGPHERHVLDVFTSPDVGSGKPVVVFIHGGGFSRGAKRTPGSPFYDNVMLWAQSKGLVGVNINYRLAPEFQWPSGIEDMTRVMKWLKANIAQYGGDPGKIFLWGHSAGAAHAADYIAFETNAGRDPGVAGAILTSGFYELGPEVSIWKAYYGEDVSKYPERSSLPGLLKSSVPLFVNDAELDPENFRKDTQKLIDAFAKAGKPLRTLHLPGHSHISETYAVGTSDESLSGPVLQFILDVARNAEKQQ
jgi:acetyl esterase/lipase